MPADSSKFPPPPPIEGETPAARRFRTTLPGYFLRLKQPEIPGIWGSWDPSEGPQRNLGSDWPQVDMTQTRPGESLEVESLDVQKVVAGGIGNSRPSIHDQMQNVSAGSPESPRNACLAERLTKNTDATAPAENTNVSTSDPTDSSTKRSNSEVSNTHASRMWDVAAPGSSTLTFDDTIEYASVLASVSEGQREVNRQQGSISMSTGSGREKEHDADGARKHESGKKTGDEPESLETRSRPGWFGQGSIWSF